MRAERIKLKLESRDDDGIDNLHSLQYKQYCLYCKECKHWLAQQGATFRPGKGSNLKVYLEGKQSILPMHNTDLKKGAVEGASRSNLA